MEISGVYPPRPSCSSCCFSYDFRQQFRSFIFAKSEKCSAICNTLPKKTRNLVPELLRFNVIFHISQTSSKFGQRQLIMKN